MEKKSYMLIVDDMEVNRTILAQMFKEQFDVLEAGNGQIAIDLLEQYKDEIVIVLLDVFMPVLNGFAVMKYMAEQNFMDSIPVILITGDDTTQTEEISYSYGVSDIIHKPFVPSIVMRRTKNVVDLYQNKRHMQKRLEEQAAALNESNRALRETNEFMIDALSSIVEFRSLESGEHIRRIKYFTRILLKYLAKYFPKYDMTPEKIDYISRAAAMHDIGKIGIRENILLKPGKLTEEEFEIMKTHTTIGCDILSRFDKMNDRVFFDYCYEICRHHHERFDGKGYPDHLKGDEIPISAQIVSIADVYDALVNKRVYKEAFTHELAVQMINNGECGTFSPDILECFNLAKEDFLNMSLMELPAFTD